MANRWEQITIPLHAHSPFWFMTNRKNAWTFGRALDEHLHAISLVVCLYNSPKSNRAFLVKSLRVTQSLTYSAYVSVSTISSSVTSNLRRTRWDIAYFYANAASCWYHWLFCNLAGVLLNCFFTPRTELALTNGSLQLVAEVFLLHYFYGTDVTSFTVFLIQKELQSGWSCETVAFHSFMILQRRFFAEFIILR